MNSLDVCRLSSFTRMSGVDFIEIIKSLSPSKSSGTDDLPTKLVLDAMEARPDIFVKICNTSLMNGVFPKQCKLARISVIPKKGNTKILDKLCPISISSVLGRILEKHVKKDLVGYLEANHLFYYLQFGFRG